MLNFEVLSESIDIADYLFSDLGVRYHGKSGKNYVIDCPNPMHLDKNPSCFFDPEKLIWHCFGCRESGTIIDLVQRYRDISRMDAREELISLMGMGVDQVSKSFKKRFEDTKKMTEYNLSTEYRRDWVNARTEILQMVKRRRFNLLLFDKFFIGFNNFKITITMPIVYRKKIINIGERYVLGTGKSKIKYLPRVSPDYCVWGMFTDDYDPNDPHLTEGIFDAIRLREAGFNAYALLSNQLSENKMRFIYNHFCGEFTVWPDNDKGGELLVEDWKKVLHFSDVKIARLEKSKDPDEASVSELKETYTNRKSLRKEIYDFNMKVKEEVCNTINR